MTQTIAIPHVLWLFLAFVLFAIGIGSSVWSGIVQRREINRMRGALTRPVTGNDSQSNRLKIIEAHWGIEGINDPEVTPDLKGKQHGHCFAEPVVLDLFHGNDPVSGDVHKRLKVRYSFDGKESVIERPEKAWLILPEDQFLKDQLETCQRQSKLEQNQLNAELSRSKECYRQCEEERRDYANRSLEYRAEIARYTDLLIPLQLEAFTLAKELRDFLASLEPFPTTPTQKLGENNIDFLVRYSEAVTEDQARWGRKLLHGYANRGFGPRITSLMHRVGEEFEYHARWPESAEKPDATKDCIPKLAQEVEMVAIWINRKQRNEVNLLR